MRHFLCLIIVCHSILITIGQPNSSNPTNTTIAIRLLNSFDVKELVIKNEKGFTMQKAPVNDTVVFRVPVGETYSLSINGVETENSKISIPSEARLRYFILHYRDKQHASLVPVDNTYAVVFVRRMNLYNKPVADDHLVIKPTHGTATYSLTTGIDGIGYVLVPKGDEYSLSLDDYANFYSFKVDSARNKMFTQRVRIKYPSPAEIKLLQEELTRNITLRDSLYKAVEKIKELPLNQFIDNIVSEANKAAVEYKADPHYFEKKQNVVCAALSRNKNNWQNKTIVTDVTGSMYPYMRQVALWHTIELMSNEKSEYVFFNDGNNKPDNLKKIGNTGGLYVNPSHLPDSVLKTMYVAMKKGSGGDAPENDIEALIKAQEIKSDSAELILIADNYAPVKDISLLDKLHHPVRVILCGVIKTIHPDYLELAFKTGGSIHTIEEDITTLSKLHDEEIITIGGKTYQLIKGKFFPFSAL